MITFRGQKRQDIWVTQILGEKTNGYFVDLAAADGITHSNTHFLEKEYLWDGICIEPNPVFFDSLKAERNCICENLAISNRNEVVDFRIDNGQCGGIVADDTDNNIKTRSGQLKTAEIIQVQANTLEYVLDKHQAPSIIDYLSLDIEGSEERVIENFNFDKYRFNCITIERPTKLVNDTLFRNGYVFVKNYQYDSFYVHEEIQLKYSIYCDYFEQLPKKNK